MKRTKAIKVSQRYRVRAMFLGPHRFLEWADRAIERVS